MHWAYGGWGGQRRLLPCPAKALPTSLLYWVGRHSTVIDPFSGCDFGFDYGFDFDCGCDCGCHSWVICSFHGPYLGMGLFLFLAVMETGLADSLRMLYFLLAEPLCAYLGEWRRP